MSLKSFGKAFATLAVSMLICGNAYGAIESDRAVMLSPAKDGAYVVKMLGLTNNKKIVLLDGARKTIHDGIVIRASKIENGKIIIPAGGMYTTSRCSNWWSFNDHTFTAAGKLYHFITDEFQQDVVKNVTMKEGEMVFGNEAKTRGWQLTYLGGNPYGVEGAQNLEFKLVKTTGNYYGNPFLIVAGDNVPNSACDGTHLKNGSTDKPTTCWREQGNPLDHFVGNTIATNNRSSVTVESCNEKEVKVKEFVTVSTKKALISPNDPIMGLYGKGDSFKVGKATVKVTAVGTDNATVEVTDAKGTVTKTIGIKAEDRKLFPSSRFVCQGMMAQSKGGTETVNVNIHNKGGFIVDGKVALMAYSDVMTVTEGSQWTDPAYIARPEICAECSFIHEIMIENDKPIVLDAKNNVAVGPNGYWKVVIDEFDGKTIKAWHIETAKDKTGNLAGRSKGKHIDAVVGAECRSTAQFFGRVYKQLYKEAVSK